MEVHYVKNLAQILDENAGFSFQELNRFVNKASNAFLKP
jgi:hypothetical protein